MLRAKILLWVLCIAATFGPIGPSPSGLTGWEVAKRVVLRAVDPELTKQIPDSWKGSGAGEETFLHLDYLAVHGHAYPTRDQKNSPSCVGQAVSAAIDFLAATEIHRFGENERVPPANVSAEVMYGLSRQEIGELGNVRMGGSYNLWACQAAQRYGTIPQRNYALLGIDLAKFDPTRAVLYGGLGCPDSLEPMASKHKIREYYAVNSWRDCRDAVFNGCPVVVGSPQGFGNQKKDLQRDRDGFLNPPRRFFFPSIWRHSMVIIAMCDKGGRPGALVLNSWGLDWISGPVRFGHEPPGSFWVDAKIIDKMVKAKDSYALRGFDGYRL